ncbi:MAG: hypothetical protein IIW23_04150, partial [Clostridia bacterium]|nr:hypothetical protein [Clostridia bacterium]
MNISKRLLKAVAATLAVISVLSLAPQSILKAEATVYGGFADPRDLKSSLQSYSSADAPVVKDIKLASNNVARFDKVEITFNIDAAWENPFDPEDILVDGVFIYPSGKEVTIP